ncbi:MarR family transcriptional regulator [Deinococcus sp.]|uniref:GbsR/MarR family transcriptional regulator n=1 Tax=Deinococcus sp. TaxID=47478 RepID=UPI002869958E|nr:MarR family transcriptional regulator [Deinococcus sp.]
MDGSLQFIERAGVMLEMIGMPRISGRVLGALLCAPPGGHTAAELSTRLQSSRAGVGTGLKHLTLMGLIEHAPNPGERADRFRMRQGAWATLTEQGNRKLETFVKLADEGLAALPPGGNPGPLREMAAFYRLWLELFPGVLNQWHQLESGSGHQANGIPPTGRAAGLQEDTP